MEEILILVDENDRETGTATREECHIGEGRHHRAFIVFLFNNRDELLLQRRGKNKLWAHKWDCSAGSHVRVGETYETAVRRCLMTELRVVTKTERALAFNYFAKLGVHCENEFCVLLVGFNVDKVEMNPDHVADIRYAELEDVRNEVKSRPEDYTPWFKIALDRYPEPLGS